MAEKNENSSVLLLSTSTYKKLRLTQIVVPLLGSLYFGIGTIWGMPGIEEVTATVTVFVTFLAGIIKVSEGVYDNSEARFDGDMVVKDDGQGNIVYEMELNRDAGEFKDDNSIVFKVVRKPLSE